MGGMTKYGLLAAVLAVLLIASFIWGYNRGYDASTADMEKRLNEVELTKAVKPQPTKVGNVGVVKVPVEMALKEPEEPELPENKILLFPVRDEANRLNSHDSLCCHVGKDSVAGGYGDSTLVAYVPIRQKVYKDSSYTAYVSGYKANLDSLIIRSKVITETRTKYRRWNVGISGGYGYGFVSHKMEPFLGVGVTWNVFR